MKKSKTVIIVGTVVLLCGVLGTVVPMPLAALGAGPTFNTLGTIEVEVQNPPASSTSAPPVTESEKGRIPRKGDRTAAPKAPQKTRVPVVQIEGAPVDRTDGQLDMTTVNVLTGLNFFDVLNMSFRRDWDLVPLSTIIPPGMKREEVTKQQQAEMVQSENAAVTAALHYLHNPVATFVGGIVPKGPAVNKLHNGDQIVMVKGKSVVLATDVFEALRGTKPGDEVPVTVLRDGQAVTHTIKLMSGAPDINDRGLLGIGVYSQSLGTVRVSINLSDVGGPSAGLMFTLAIIDKLTPGSLTGGKHIAGTGTISYDGTVGPIGGIAHKMVGAHRAGARYFLVPTKNCAEAVQSVPQGMMLIRVDDLDGALFALDALQHNRTVPTCRVR